jgi:hypothetical protein
MTTKEIRKEWCKMKGFNYIDFDTLKEAEEYILFLESKLEALNIADVVKSLPDDEISQVFMNNFDCYAEADTPDGLVSEQAMTQQKFVDTIKGLKQ